MRLTGNNDRDLVVFLIGMRVNKWWRLDQIIWTGLSMGKMLKELHADKSLGLMGYESWGGRTTIMVQYWESFEKLEAFAKDRELSHFPTWKSFYKKAAQSNGAVGIWHETYQVKAGTYETVYSGLPPFGLGKVNGTKEIGSKTQTASQRINA